MIANTVQYSLDLHNQVYLFEIAITWILFASPNNLGQDNVQTATYGCGVKLKLSLKAVII